MVKLDDSTGKTTQNPSLRSEDRPLGSLEGHDRDIEEMEYFLTIYESLSLQRASLGF